MGKQRFDKKNAQKFRLVPGNLQHLDSESASNQNNEILDPETRKAEQVKYGILFDDDYDYMQHLKSSSEIAHLEPLTSNTRQILTNFPLQFSEEADSDTISDADIDEVDLQLGVEDVNGNSDELEDDFIIQASGGTLPALDEHGLVLNGRKIGGNGLHNFKKQDSCTEDDDDDEQSGVDEMEIYFKNKCTLGGVVKTSTERDLLEERLAKVLEEYSDDDIGALEDVEICGGSLQPNDDLFKQAEEDFEKRRRVNKNPAPVVRGTVSLTKTLPDKIGDDETDSTNDSEADDEFEKIKVSIKPKPNKLYNCESILSITSSCIPSHLPRIISEKNRLASASKPVCATEREKSVKDCQNLSESDDNTVDSNSSLFVRKRGETPDERKARKSAVREMKKERRSQKKALKSVFRSEQSAIEREMAPNNMGAVRLV